MDNFYKEKRKDSPFENFFKDLFIGVLVVGIVSLAILLGFQTFTGNSIYHEEVIKKCGDGTLYGTCSLSKPYYCSEGVLVERSSYCGCPEGMDKEGGLCVYDRFYEPKDLVFYYVLEGERRELTFRTYKGVYDYVSDLPRTLSYQEGEAALRSDFKLNKIDDEIQRQALKPLVVKIQNLAPNRKVDQARIAISLVQNIEYGASEEFIDFGSDKIRLSRFPYQTVYDKKASCEGKSELLAFILRELGYGTAFFYYPVENHESVGIKCPVDESLMGSGYCFVETTSPSIITDDGGEYLGAGFLLHEPELVVISEGIDLPKGIEEYRDAYILDRIRNKERFNIFTKSRFYKIVEKYGLGI